RYCPGHHPAPPPFPTRRSSDLEAAEYLRSSRQRVYDLLSQRRLTRFKEARRTLVSREELARHVRPDGRAEEASGRRAYRGRAARSEEHTSELQSRGHLVCRLLL